jgi:hypothetical protein
MQRKKRQWWEKNPHNRTERASDFDIEACQVGKGTYGPIKELLLVAKVA